MIIGKDRKVEYIGDGVYVYKEYGGVWLLANDHLQPTDSIYLEPSVYKALCDFMNRPEKT